MDNKLIAKDLIIKARVILQKTHPFFAYLSQYLMPKEVDGKDIPTMGVDINGQLFYNPEWVAKLTLSQAKGVLSHEVMHIAFEHLKYLKHRQGDIANVAMDIVINDAIVTNNLELPPEGIIPSNHSVEISKVKIDNINKKCWEEVYDELMKKLPKNSKPKQGFDQHIRGAEGQGKGKDGKGADGTGKGKDAPDWKQLLNEAYTYAKMQGNAPAGLDRYIDSLNSPKINWKEYLQKFIIREIPFDFSYSRPSKKSVSTGVFLPSVMRENLEIAIGVDTSGSMSPADLKECVGEVLGIIRAYDCVTLTVLACDSEVHNVQDVKDESDLLNFKFGGGGGTSFKPVFKWLEENKSHTKLLIFFTDGYGDFPESEPSIRTLWVLSKQSIGIDKVPFGEAVQMEDYKDADR